MRLDSSRADSVHVSPATWGAVGALVLLLGTLSLLLLGCDRVFGLQRLPCPDGTVLTSDGACADRVLNYYACECECTKGLSVGADIRTAQPIAVRSNPGATSAIIVAAGVDGTVVDEQDVVVGGGTVKWWKIQFVSNVLGWTNATSPLSLTVLSSDPLLTKDLQVCLPPEFNENLGTPPFEGAPDSAGLTADCTDRVLPAFAASAGQLPPGSTCGCTAAPAVKAWAAECDAPCSDLNGVCLVAGTDPPEPTPDTLSTALFTTTSTCEVSGDAEVHLDDKVFNTSVNGVVHIHGKPCQGPECQVGVSYQLKLGDIEIPVRFRTNPVFGELTVAGASEPLAVNLARFLGPLYVGVIPPQASLNSARGRRQGGLIPQPALVIVGRNGADLGVSVDWVNKRCLITGSFVGGPNGGVVDDDGNIVDIQLHLTAGGLTDPLSRMVNQPPLANAGSDQTLECTSPEGAAVTLAGTSTDADNNIAFYTWRRDSENGAHVAPPSPSPTVTTQQGIGETTYHLRAVDARLSADNDAVTVKVVDRTPAAIDCHAPVTIPKQGQPISFKATATDTCGPAPAVVVENVECFKESPKGRIKDNPSCKASIQGDTLTIGNSAGADLIRWSARTADAAGNPTTKTCEVRVD